MSGLFDGLMDFTKKTTIAMLADATNAPKYTSNEDGTIDDPQNIAPLDYSQSVGVIKDPNSDYCLYMISFLPGENISKQIDVSTDGNSNRVTKYVRNLKIDWQCYGDDGMEWADTLRIMLFSPDIKALFAAQGISLIPENGWPVYIPEMKGKQWYHRYDLTAKFNQLVTRQKVTQIITSPNITIEDSKGVIISCQY